MNFTNQAGILDTILNPNQKMHRINYGGALQNSGDATHEKTE